MLPIPYSVRLYEASSLFAGKMHALLCRNWKERVKGRDFYDYVWYLSKRIPLHIRHLEARMRQSGHWTSSEALDRQNLLKLIEDKCRRVDFTQAKKDVLPFIQNSKGLDLWSEEFFISITQNILIL